ncbi:MAG: hypothetical protein ACI912_001835, partial [Marinobacter psychrophilus]|uniref:hypothetical protein n=1 Tax=Marinobacter psychrophilus TaxID=330734 RepID=UPI0039E3EB7E
RIAEPYCQNAKQTTISRIRDETAQPQMPFCSHWLSVMAFLPTNFRTAYSFWAVSRYFLWPWQGA